MKNGENKQDSPEASITDILIDKYQPDRDGFGTTALSGAGFSIDGTLGRSAGRWEAEMEPGKIWNQGPTPKDPLRGKSQL